MALFTLLAQSGAAGTVGNSYFIGSTGNGLAQFQFNPSTVTGFTGTVVIEASNVANPGNGDWFQILSCEFSAHTTVMALNVYQSSPWLRARIPSGTVLGSISAYVVA